VTTSIASVRSLLAGISGPFTLIALGTIGCYWTATAQIPMQFPGPPPPLVKRLDSGVSAGIQIAVRYVRRL
jgi:hypothetical protein